MLFVFAFVTNTYPQTSGGSSPEEVSLSLKRLERIHSTIQNHIDKEELSGTVTLISRHGKIVNFEALGMSGIEEEKKMTTDAIFRIASMTKLVTSIAALLLYEEGKFFLDDPVSKYIPEFKDMKVAAFENGSISKTVPAKNKITIRNLFTHTSGITYGTGYPGLNELYDNASLYLKREEGLRSFVQTLAQLPLAFEPGTKWEYSFSVDVLGYLVEVISGQKLNEFCKERIFIPLGMKDTDFYVPTDKLNRLTTLYDYQERKLIPTDTPENTSYNILPRGCSGGGGLVSTAADYAILCQMLLNKGELNGTRILSKKTVELMFLNHLQGIPNDNWYQPYAGFGLGGAVMEDPGMHGDYTSKGMFWWAGIYNTYFFIDPAEDMFGIIMAQISPFRHLDLMRKFKILCYQALTN